MPSESKGRGRLATLLQTFSGALELPQDIVLDVPRATLIGSVQLQVGNHKGVLEYTPTRVRVRTRDGVIEVTGSRLRIGSIFRDEMTVEGRIDKVELRSARKESGGRAR